MYEFPGIKMGTVSEAHFHFRERERKEKPRIVRGLGVCP